MSKKSRRNKRLSEAEIQEVEEFVWSRNVEEDKFLQTMSINTKCKTTNQKLLVNSIKRNDPNSHISVVSSTKNHHFIKSFKNVDEVIILKNSLLEKIKLTHKLRSNYYDKIIVHDAKNRSYIISLFLKYGFKLKPNNDLNISYIDSIKEMIYKLFHSFYIHYL